MSDLSLSASDKASADERSSFPFLFQRPPFPSAIPNAPNQNPTETSLPAGFDAVTNTQIPVAPSILGADNRIDKSPSLEYFPQGHALPCNIHLLSAFDFDKWVDKYSSIMQARSARQIEKSNQNQIVDKSVRKSSKNTTQPIILDHSAISGSKSKPLNNQAEEQTNMNLLEKKLKRGIQSWAPYTPVLRKPVLARRRTMNDKSSRREAKRLLKEAKQRKAQKEAINEASNNGDTSNNNVNKIQETLEQAFQEQDDDSDADNGHDHYQHQQAKIYKLQMKASKTSSLPFIVNPFAIRELWTNPIPESFANDSTTFSNQQPKTEESQPENISNPASRSESFSSFNASPSSTAYVKEEEDVITPTNTQNEPDSVRKSSIVSGSNTPGTIHTKIKLRTKLNRRPEDESKRKKLFYYLDRDAINGPLNRFIGLEKEKTLNDLFYLNPGLLSNHPDAIEYRNRLKEEYKHNLQMYERDLQKKKKFNDELDPNAPKPPKFIDYDIEDFITTDLNIV